MKKKGFLILGLIFGLSTLFIITLKSLSNPVFISQPVFGQLNSPFNIVDFKGDTISSCEWNDKIVLYNFLSVDCPTDFEKCPFRLEWFKIKIYNELVDNKGFDDVIVVSSFVDSYDNVDQRIKEFREYNKIDSDKWIMTSSKYIPFFNNDFITGNPWLAKDTLFGFERQAHLMTLLVDQDQKIRGKYFSYNFGEIRRITKEISLLIKEEISHNENKELPVYGNKDFDPSIDTDTVFHVIPYWSFLNQNSKEINSDQFSDKVCLVDFFFTNCPSICPKLTLKMKDVQDQLNTECIDNVELLSFTVDPRRDSVKRLKDYSKNYNVNDNNWNLLTGDQSTIYELGVNGFLVPNQEDALAPGGFLHSEKLILIDKKGRIRGYYDGTDSSNTNTIVQHTKQLNQE
jgi:protein SCO1/2